MPYIVITETTPLWQDHQMTTERGTIKEGVEFEAGGCFPGTDTLHTDSILYVPKRPPRGMVLVPGEEIDGSGWIERKNVQAFTVSEPDSPPSPAPPAGELVGKYIVTITKME